MLCISSFPINIPHFEFVVSDCVFYLGIFAAVAATDIFLIFFILFIF